MTHTTLDADLIFRAVSEAIDSVHANDDHPNALSTIYDFIRRAMRQRRRLQLDRAKRYVAEMRRSRLAASDALKDTDGVLHWAIDGRWLGVEVAACGRSDEQNAEFIFGGKKRVNCPDCRKLMVEAENGTAKPW